MWIQNSTEFQEKIGFSKSMVFKVEVCGTVSEINALLFVELDSYWLSPMDNLQIVLLTG